MIPDHYQALGVQPGAAAAELRAAYLRLMRENHPDVRPGDETAGETARAVNEAWRVLRDAERRRSYDALRAGRYPGAPDRVRTMPPPPPDGPPAYSAEGVRYRRTVSTAIVKLAAAAFALGLVALGAVGG